MCYWHNQFDMTTTLSTNLLLCYLNTTTVADNTLITDTLIFSTGTLIVFGRTEDALAEQTVALGLIGAVVDGLWFGHLTITTLKDLFGRSKSDGNFRKITLYF